MAAAPPGVPGAPAAPPAPPAPAAQAAAAGQVQPLQPPALTGIYRVLNPINPWPQIADSVLDNMTDAEIINLLRVHPSYAAYVVAGYGRRRGSRWTDPCLSLRNPEEPEWWHRARDREWQLKVDLAWLEHQRPFGNTPAAKPFAQKIHQVRMQLESTKRQSLLCTLRNVVANQAAYNPLAGLAQPSPLQQHYIAWRAQILQSLAASISACDSELRKQVILLVTWGPNPARPTRLIRLQDPLNPAWYPTAAATFNLNRNPCLIDKLVQHGCVDALRFLRRLGVFTPVSYTRQGHTMLHEALSRENRLATRYLLQSYLPMEIWTRPYGTTSLQHDPDEPSDLEFLVQHERFEEFERIWRRIYPLFATLPPAQQPQGWDVFKTGNLHDILAAWATRAFAEALAAPPLNLDLATIVPWAHNQRIPLEGETVWHLGVLNDNVDFMDFLWRVPANKATIDDVNTIGPPIIRPLELAIRNGQRDHAARLIQYGAVITRWTIEDINKELPTTTDRLWQALLYSTSTDLRIGAGTFDGGWLHDIVNGLNDHIRRITHDQNMTRAQKAKEKKMYIGRAKSLIQKIIAGTVYSMPVDVNMVNAVGLTARALAEQLELSTTVINALQ